MYQEIDELIKAICKDKIFIDYEKSEKSLYNQDTQFLLLKHKMLQEDYLKNRKYLKYVSMDETKQALLDIKTEMKNNLVIQNYYNSYYQLNELLEEVTQVIFNNISKDIKTEMFKL